MVNAKLKTKETSVAPKDFIHTVQDEQQRQDSLVILKMMEDATKFKPKMWGSSIIGCGDVHLKYESGRELDWFNIGFSPRKGQITLYLINGSDEQQKYLDILGKFTTGKGCLYIKRLSDVNLDVLKDLIQVTVDSK